VGVIQFIQLIKAGVNFENLVWNYLSRFVQLWQFYRVSQETFPISFTRNFFNLSWSFSLESLIIPFLFGTEHNIEGVSKKLRKVN
jgi:hypothetical protein